MKEDKDITEIKTFRDPEGIAEAVKESLGYDKLAPAIKKSLVHTLTCPLMDVEYFERMDVEKRYTVTEISEKTNIPKRTIRHWLRSNNIEKQGGQYLVTVEEFIVSISSDSNVNIADFADIYSNLLTISSAAKKYEEYPDVTERNLRLWSVEQRKIRFLQPRKNHTIFLYRKSLERFLKRRFDTDQFPTVVRVDDSNSYTKQNRSEK